MFSVVIPAYNCENTIVATIDSVLRQTRIDLIEEIIVVNDGSEDQTEKIYGIRSLKHNGKRIGESLVFLKSDPQIWVDLGKPMHIDSVLCSIDITSPIPDRVIEEYTDYSKGVMKIELAEKRWHKILHADRCNRSENQ